MAFYRKEILEWTQWGFSIVLSETNAITLFGMALRISLLASVYQVKCKPHLICNSSEELDAATPLVNASIYPFISDICDVQASVHGGHISNIRTVTLYSQ